VQPGVISEVKVLLCKGFSADNLQHIFIPTLRHSPAQFAPLCVEVGAERTEIEIEQDFSQLPFTTSVFKRQ
jgi:hypothetical protein